MYRILGMSLSINLYMRSSLKIIINYKRFQHLFKLYFANNGPDKIRSSLIKPSALHPSPSYFILISHFIIISYYHPDYDCAN